jgi:hypothetical protein
VIPLPFHGREDGRPGLNCAFVADGARVTCANAPATGDALGETGAQRLLSDYYSMTVTNFLKAMFVAGPHH